GGNLTGFVAVVPDMAAKRFQLIKEIKPEARRAAVLWNPSSSNARLELDASKKSAAANGIVVAIHDARDVGELRKSLDSIRQSGSALTDLLGGQVQLYFGTLPGSIEYIKVGKLGALDVTHLVTAFRHGLRETGYSSRASSSRFGT